LERNGELIEVTILIQLVMFLSHTYGLCLELEHSHFDIIIVVYNSYALVMLYLTNDNHSNMIIAYELAYSSHVMFMLLMMLCFEVHIMFMDRNRLVLGRWFIMPSGTSKSFTCRSVGSGIAGDLGGQYICGQGVRVYSGA
jgi:hypothetical protein